MNDSQFHRGPDESGIHVEPGVGLGHRRLSIIDLSSGQQPLYNEDRSVVVSYNGEIYNFKELAESLISKGHVFNTKCDTEVVVHAWEEWGDDCVNKFRGMFAFAIWDRNRRTLFLARDRLGIKPLYYSILPDGELLFASELKALLVHPRLPRVTDDAAIEEFFALGYIPEPRTIFEHAQKLPPGHTLLARHGEQVRIKQYWDVPQANPSSIRAEEMEAQLVDQIREAVSIRMLSDVPLGAFLSGGVDSSAVVAMMATSSQTSVKTCSMAFAERGYDESEYADMVAARYATEHAKRTVEVNDFQLLDKLAAIYDEPYADSSAIPTYRVCELAREKVTVALSGDGGDELFAGYRRHRWHMNEELIRSRVPHGVRKPLFGTLGYIYPKADWAPKLLRAKTTFQALAKDSLEAYLHSVSIVSEGLRRKLFSQEFLRRLDGYRATDVFKRHAASAPAEDPLSLIQYLDMKTYLPGDILTKVDRASMAHSLEVRVPLLDHKLVEWVTSISPAYKLRKREGKYIFKKSMENYLPHDILYRPKMGFGVPVSEWFRGPLRSKVRNSLLSSNLSDLRVFDMRVVERLVNEHQSGIGEHSAALWSLLMFSAFVDNTLEGGTVPGEPFSPKIAATF